MKGLEQKHILLGITGGIAAYKSADLVRRLRKQGAQVQVAMTDSACEFVTPLTFQALSGHPVRTDTFDTSAEGAMSHIELARWADAILIAPCSANTLAKIAQGIADNLLSTLILASAAPVLIAPAMNRQMWAHSATQSNVEILQQRGVQILGPGTGEQACGEQGAGRMLEPMQLVKALADSFQHQTLTGKRVLITAGPTREAVDPVRFLSNRSSGKMGFALARAAQEAGATITLISGPVAIPAPEGIEPIYVETALDMRAAVFNNVSQSDIFISCAAVSDYRPANPSPQKIKKDDDAIRLELVKNPDILADVANLTERPFLVGFAAETHNLIAHARNKLQRKKLDLIAANQVGERQGFEQDENALTVIWQDGQQELPCCTKEKLARQLVDIISDHYSQRIGNNEKRSTKNT